MGWLYNGRGSAVDVTRAVAIQHMTKVAFYCKYGGLYVVIVMSVPIPIVHSYMVGAWTMMIQSMYIFLYIYIYIFISLFQSIVNIKGRIK